MQSTPPMPRPPVSVKLGAVGERIPVIGAAYSNGTERHRDRKPIRSETPVFTDRHAIISFLMTLK
jgi:hypothetical protein